MLNKKKLNIGRMETFLSMKISANSANTAYTLGLDGPVTQGEPDILWQTVCYIKDVLKIWTGGCIYDCKDNPSKVSELENDSEFITLDYIPTKTSQLNNDAGFLTKNDTDKLYLSLGSNSTSSASISVSKNGSFNNFGDNGLAFNAVRDLTGTTKYLGNTGSGFPINAASFGVKDNGTTAFSHKKYSTFDKTTGTYTGAKNTAVLVFSGNSGLLYAKNTGSANDVTDDMYKYVGVIDSPDEKLKVYSATQVNSLISKIKVILTRLGATDEEIASITI